jgi:hypothetical protein
MKSAENMFDKHRYDKTSASFLSFVQIAAIHRWMRFVHTA